MTTSTGAADEPLTDWAPTTPAAPDGWPVGRGPAVIEPAPVGMPEGPPRGAPDGIPEGTPEGLGPLGAAPDPLGTPPPRAAAADRGGRPVPLGRPLRGATPEGPTPEPKGAPDGIPEGAPDRVLVVVETATTSVDKAELRAGQSVMEAAQLVTVWMLVE